MSTIFAIICVIGLVVAIVFVSTLGLGGWLKAAIIVPMVLFAVYSMARIPPQESATGKDTSK